MGQLCCPETSARKYHSMLREIPKAPKSHVSKIIVESYHTCFVIEKSQVQISALRQGILRFFKLRDEAEQWVWLTVQSTDCLKVMILGENEVKNCERGGSELFQDRFISSVLYFVFRSLCRLSWLLATPTTRCFFYYGHVKLVLWRLIIRSHPIVWLGS